VVGKLQLHCFTAQEWRWAQPQRLLPPLCKLAHYVPTWLTSGRNDPSDASDGCHCIGTVADVRSDLLEEMHLVDSGSSRH
jgi:hypothetical protein